MSTHELKISTIVRFVSGGGGLAGCSASPRVEVMTVVCDERLPPVCSTFGGESRCACMPRNDLERFLGGRGSAAWPGAID